MPCRGRLRDDETVARQSSPLPDMGRTGIFDYIEQSHNPRRQRPLQMLNRWIYSTQMSRGNGAEPADITKTIGFPTPNENLPVLTRLGRFDRSLGESTLSIN